MTGIALPSSLLKAPDGKCQKIYYSCSHAPSTIDRKQEGGGGGSFPGLRAWANCTFLSYTQVSGAAFATAFAKLKAWSLGAGNLLSVAIHVRSYDLDNRSSWLPSQTAQVLLAPQATPERWSGAARFHFLKHKRACGVSVIQILLPRPSC